MNPCWTWCKSVRGSKKNIAFSWRSSLCFQNGCQAYQSLCAWVYLLCAEECLWCLTSQKSSRQCQECKYHDPIWPWNKVCDHGAFMSLVAPKTVHVSDPKLGTKNWNCWKVFSHAWLCISSQNYWFIVVFWKAFQNAARWLFWPMASRTTGARFVMQPLWQPELSMTRQQISEFIDGQKERRPSPFMDSSFFEIHFCSR